MTSVGVWTGMEVTEHVASETGDDRRVGWLRKEGDGDQSDES